MTKLTEKKRKPSQQGEVSPLAVELSHIGKSFGDCVANWDVNLKVRKGEIHGIVGENGAGKSTAMKILYGLYPPTTGQIFVDGVERHWKSPKEAIEAGIGMVHQHFMLAGPHTVLDNIILAKAPTLFQKIPYFLNTLDRKKALKTLQKLAERFSLKIDFNKKIDELPVGVQQRIEIIKLLYLEAKILILDEPTAVLTPQETAELFKYLKQLRDEGKTILVITHKLKEVMELTDRITILRGGKVTGSLNTSDTNVQELADLMVGRKVVLHVQAPPAPKMEEGDLKPVLEIKNLTWEARHQLGGMGTPEKNILTDINLTVKKGEIVGVAGIEGNGQSELIKSILFPHLKGPNYGPRKGDVFVFGQNTRHLTTQEIKDLGVGVIPEDRHREGLLLDSTLEENFLLGQQTSKNFFKWGFTQKNLLIQETERALEEFDVRPRDRQALARSLSGGNQQKLIVAREFFRQKGFLICAQPTRGVDVGAIEFIHQRILAARVNGTGVLLISSELEEIIGLSDRIVVIYEGRITGECRRGEWDEKVLGLYMGGGKR